MFVLTALTNVVPSNGTNKFVTLGSVLILLFHENCGKKRLITNTNMNQMRQNTIYLLVLFCPYNNLKKKNKQTEYMYMNETDV